MCPEQTGGGAGRTCWTRRCCGLGAWTACFLWAWLRMLAPRSR